MRNKQNLLIVSVLMAGSVFAQQTSVSVGEILAELMKYTGPQAPAAEKIAPVVQASPKAEQKPETVVKPVETSPAVEDTTNPTAPEARVEENSELFDGEFTAASQGLADLAKIAPENLAARMYTRTLMERDHRTVEIDGMDAVDAAWSMEMVLRTYTLTDGAANRMQLDNEGGAVDVASLFPQVDFPKEASAIYQPETETIFVNNTPENLAVMETMLETMGVLRGYGDALQVEIEAKFVEVTEGTLEELGFQWNFAENTHVGLGGTDLDVNDGESGLFSDALRGSPYKEKVLLDKVNTWDPDVYEWQWADKGGDLPFEGKLGLGAGGVGASGDWSSFRFVDTFSQTAPFLKTKYTGGNAFEMAISALDQSTGADVLSAPRVLTRSGEEASIQVGELHYFPDVYETGNSPWTLPNVVYQDFSEKLLGVELTVTPKVNDERQIRLELNPRISELAGWQSYELAPQDSIYTYWREGQGVSFGHPKLLAQLPIFKVRKIKTTVTIADGSTIGMGGLINEKIEAFEDKVPVLGNLPLVGRLFRSEGERVVKRNLLMFVTAKIIEPTGRINTSRSFE